MRRKEIFNCMMCSGYGTAYYDKRRPKRPRVADGIANYSRYSIEAWAKGGHLDLSDYNKLQCHLCNGAGKLVRIQDGGTRCDTCLGRGTIGQYNHTCPHCHGYGLQGGDTLGYEDMSGNSI